MEPGAGDVMLPTWCIIGSGDARLDRILESLVKGALAEEPVNFPAPRTFHFNSLVFFSRGTSSWEKFALTITLLPCVFSVLFSYSASCYLGGISLKSDCAGITSPACP